MTQRGATAINSQNHIAPNLASAPADCKMDATRPVHVSIGIVFKIYVLGHRAKLEMFFCNWTCSVVRPLSA